MKEQYSPKQLQARDLYQRGLSTRQVAKLVKASPSTVTGWVRDLLRTKEQAWEVSAHKSLSPRKCRERARAKMERHLGRTLKRTEHVHHKDSDYTNNDLSNLAVLTEREHAELHRVRRYRGQSAIPAGTLPF